MIDAPWYQSEWCPHPRKNLSKKSDKKKLWSEFHYQKSNDNFNFFLVWLPSNKEYQTTRRIQCVWKNHQKVTFDFWRENIQIIWFRNKHWFFAHSVFKKKNHFEPFDLPKKILTNDSVTSPCKTFICIEDRRLISRKCIEVLLVLHSLVTHTMEIFRDIFARVNFCCEGHFE